MYICFINRDDKSWTALHVAAENASISNVVTLLAYNIELINMVDTADQTALHVACKNGYGDIVSVLLDSGADPFLPDQNGDTALDCAIKSNSQKATEILLMSDYWKEVGLCRCLWSDPSELYFDQLVWYTT